MTVFNSAMAGGIEVLFDRESGFHDRLLAAPMHRSAMLTGRYLYILLVSAAQGAVILLVAMAVGVRVATGLPGAVLAIALAVLLGVGVATLSLALAFVLKSHGTFFALLLWMLVIGYILVLAAFVEVSAWTAAHGTVTVEVDIPSPT